MKEELQSIYAWSCALRAYLLVYLRHLPVFHRPVINSCNGFHVKHTILFGMQKQQIDYHSTTKRIKRDKVIRLRQKSHRGKKC